MNTKAVFLDISGVLYNGTQVIEGAIDAIDRLQSSSLAVRFVTNTSRKTKAQIVKELVQMGFVVDANQVFTAPSAAKSFLKQKGWRPYCLVHPNIIEEFADLEQMEPNAVLIGDAENDFCYQNLNRAFQLCQQGAPLIGIGRNRYFKLNEQLHLDSGSFVHLIEYAAGCDAIIMGKPSTDFFNQVLASTGFSADEVVMIGDDVVGDVQGALDAGLRGCLVRTGKYQQGDELKIATESRWCEDSVVEVVNQLLGD